MTTFAEPRSYPDESSEQRVSSDIVRRIRKLRWIGMEEEAQQLRSALNGATDVDVVLSGPQDTD